MTHEEYLKIYQAQKQKLLHDYPNLKNLSANEFNLLEKASDFANGNDTSFDIYSLDDAKKLLDRLFTLLEKVSEEKKSKELMNLMIALKMVIDTEDDEKEDEDKDKKGKGKEDKKEKDPQGSTEENQIQPKKKEVIDSNPIVQKIKDIAEWAKQKFVQSPNDKVRSRAKQKEKIAADCSSEFDGLSRKELVEHFNPSKFYSLSDKQKQALYQATVNEYLTSNGVSPCPVKMMPMPADKNSICYGLYRPQYKEIYLNSNLFNNIETLSNDKNAYFPYHILSTLIHEATHHQQFQNVENGVNDEKTRIIKKSLTNNQSTMSYSEYLSEADELDARNSALEYFKEVSQTTTSHQDSLSAFYNTEKRSEEKKPKNPVSKEVKSFFPEIYDKARIPSSVEKIGLMKTHQNLMVNTILGTNLNLNQTLVKEKRIKPF